MLILCIQESGLLIFRESMDKYMEEATRYCTGSVRLSLYKGNAAIIGRKSPYSLYIEEIASFGESSYDHSDATGYINLYGLATGVQAIVHNRRDPKKGPAIEMKRWLDFPKNKNLHASLFPLNAGIRLELNSGQN
jgi:argininosuccinate synthase